ncbi:MAG: flagellar hook-associated protein FlgL [bacterium]|nr:flagellar hook-associated protein FlgL [bacterium]
MRISNRYLYSTVMNNIETNLEELEKCHFQLSSGKKVKYPSSDPIATVDSMRQRTYIDRIEQFDRNIDNGIHWMEHTDNVLQQVCDNLHRVRELAIQGASESYNQLNRDANANEINQILEGMIDLANTTFNGKYIFSGTDTLTCPFVVTIGDPQNLIGSPPGKSDPPFQERLGINRNNVTHVTYKGNTNPIYREIEEGVKIRINTIGDDVFSVTAHRVEMGDMTVADQGKELNDKVNYQGRISSNVSPFGTGVFRINGVKVFYDANRDSLISIKERINETKSGVKADIVEVETEDGTRYHLVLETFEPDEIWLEDIDGNLLEILGFIDPDRDAPNNIVATVKEKKISIFQMLIKLRDDLYQGNTGKDSEIERDLGYIEEALQNVLRYKAENGGKINRLEFTKYKLRDYKLHATELLQNAEEVDWEETIMNLRLQEAVNRAALASGARLIQPTLMDFL